jgi:hypothetical protein
VGGNVLVSAITGRGLRGWIFLDGFLEFMFYCISRAIVYLDAAMVSIAYDGFIVGHRWGMEQAGPVLWLAKQEVLY